MSGTQHTAVPALSDLDERYGACRVSKEVRDWEIDVKPKSLVRLTEDVGAKLRSYRILAQDGLFWNVSQCSSLIWAMNGIGEVFLAFEELVFDLGVGSGASKLKYGYPRRRGFPSHPADEKKLGHPTLVGEGSARIAGELFLDVEAEKLHWFVNCGSGRYCRDIQPSAEQGRAIHQLFIEFIDDEVRFDDPFQ